MKFANIIYDKIKVGSPNTCPVININVSISVVKWFNTFESEKLVW